MPGYWVVGSFRQRDSASATPFGRYLQDLERSFESGRRATEIAPGLWEMRWPTARNLSLPRSDLDRIGLFDERFRTTCEDQDLAQRARDVGIRFAYTTEIDCVHNDQTADLERYCSFQERGARDTVVLCAKAPELHGRAPIVQVNGPISSEDGPTLALKKACKLVLARSGPTHVLYYVIRACERLHLPEPILRRAYRLAISLAIIRGWRAGLADDTSAGARLGRPPRPPR